MALFLLFESASGYSLFEVKAMDEIGQSTAAVRKTMREYERFASAVNLVAFKPFQSVADALEQINAVSESHAPDDLKDFLISNLPKVKKDITKLKFKVGVADPKLGSALQDAISIPCICDEMTGELLRGVRMNFTRYMKRLDDRDLVKAQLGLAHSYSRAKVKFNVNRVDNMIIQAISLLDTLDKDINTFIMRVREWYSWHFPELVKIVNDNYQYSQVALLVKDKSNISKEAHLQGLKEIVGDEEKAKEIIEAAQTSMGQDISPIDLVNIEVFTKRVVSLVEYRQKLMTYLQDRMNSVAPNLSALIGEVVGARLISHAGSLTNLAKYPSSTVQILGAEKALFRALKTRGNTPKYGIIFHSTFIGRAHQKNKGRISRYLAGKCSLASRIDSFLEFSTSAYGEKLKEQCEERLRFYEEGIKTRSNLAVMHEAMEEVRKQQKAAGIEENAVAETNDVEMPGHVGKKLQKKKKRSADIADTSEEPVKKKKKKKDVPESGKKKKKTKKQQHDSVAANGMDILQEEQGQVAELKLKKKGC